MLPVCFVTERSSQENGCSSCDNLTYHRHLSMLPMHLRQVRQEERERAQQHCRTRDVRAARKLRGRKLQDCAMKEKCREDHMRDLYALLVAALKEAQKAQVLFGPKPVP